MTRILMSMKAMRNRLSGLIYGITAVLVVLWPSIALAQAAPSPSIRNAPAPWIGMFTIFFFLVLVLAISLMPSKRSHQD